MAVYVLLATYFTRYKVSEWTYHAFYEWHCVDLLHIAVLVGVLYRQQLARFFPTSSRDRFLLGL